RPNDQHRLDAARLRRLDVRRALGDADEGDHVLEPVLEVGGAELDLVAPERLVDAGLPAFRPLGLDVGVAGDPEAAELLEEARLLDAGTPGAAPARVRQGGPRGAGHPWGELCPVRGRVVVASTSVEEDAIHPAELPLQVERLGIPPVVRTVRNAHWMETLPEVLVFVAPAEDE